MADEPRYRCVATLRGHTRYVRRGVLSNKASEQSGAQVRGVAVLPNGNIVSGSGDHTLKVWDALSGACRQTLRGHTNTARRRRPVDTTRRLLVDAARGAGRLRRRPRERPRRLRVTRPHAQGLGRVERSARPDAARAHAPSAMPASSRTKALIARRRNKGRRSSASPPCRTATSCPGRTTTRSRSGT